MEIRELRVYVAVVEERGITAAARRLHLSQSSVSDTVASLERQLGTTLLVRGRAGTTETEAGRRLTAGARRLIRLHDRLRDDIVGLAVSTGPVRIGVPLELPAELIPRALAATRAAMPGTDVVAVHASSTAQWAMLRAGDIDVGLVRELQPGEDYDSALVVEDRLGVVLTVARAEELTGADGTVALAHLGGLAWNGFARSDAPASHDQVSSVLRAHGIRVPDGLADERPVTIEVKLAAVADGTRFALALPDFPVPDGIVWRRLSGDPVVRRTWAVWRADETDRGVAALVAALSTP